MVPRALFQRSKTASRPSRSGFFLIAPSWPLQSRVFITSSPTECVWTWLARISLALLADRPSSGGTTRWFRGWATCGGPAVGADCAHDDWRDCERACGRPSYLPFRVIFPLFVGAALVARPYVVSHLGGAGGSCGRGHRGRRQAISLTHGKTFLADQNAAEPIYRRRRSIRELIPRRLAMGGVAAHGSSMRARRRGSVAPRLAWAPLSVSPGSRSSNTRSLQPAVDVVSSYFALARTYWVRAQATGGSWWLGLVVNCRCGGLPDASPSKSNRNVFGSQAVSAVNLSSGRLVVWTQRLQLIDGRSVNLLLFGRRPSARTCLRPTNGVGIRRTPTMTF